MKSLAKIIQKMKLFGFIISFSILILFSVFFVGLNCKNVKRSVIDSNSCGVQELEHVDLSSRVHNPNAAASVVEIGEFPW